MWGHLNSILFQFLTGHNYSKQKNLCYKLRTFMYSAIRVFEGKWYSSVWLGRTLIFSIFESNAHCSDTLFWEKDEKCEGCNAV